MVVVTTVSVGSLAKSLMPADVWWQGPRLMRPSVVLVVPEGVVACATPASVSGARNRQPAMTMMMRFHVRATPLILKTRTNGWLWSLAGIWAPWPARVAANRRVWPARAPPGRLPAFRGAQLRLCVSLGLGGSGGTSGLRCRRRGPSR